MELNWLPSVKNVLVLTDHFRKYAMAFITKDQKAKTVAWILYEQFISVFGAPAKLLSDQGVNFTSALVEELFSAFGIQKCRSTTYHVQCNGQVERFHQTLFRMIRQLATDKKAQWEHLPELLQAYNSTRSAIMGYSPHYLMFGRWPHLPVDFFFPTIGANTSHHHVPAYVEEVQECFKEAYAEAQHQSNSKAGQQKHNYDKTTSTVQLMPEDIVLKKADTFQGKRKVKDHWSEVEYEVICQVTNGVPLYEIKDSSSNVKVAHHNWLFLLATPQGEVTPLCESEDADTSVSTQSALVELTPLECENDLPEDNMEGCLTQHLTSHIPLGWVDGILWPLPTVVHRSAHYDQGSRMKDMHDSNNEAYWVLLVNPPNMCIIPKFYTMDGGGVHKCNRSDGMGTMKILAR